MLGLTASMRDAWDPASPRGKNPADCSPQWVLSQVTLWQDRSHAHSCLCMLYCKLSLWWARPWASKACCVEKAFRKFGRLHVAPWHTLCYLLFGSGLGC